MKPPKRAKNAIKAYVFAGTHHQYQCFLLENHLNRLEYPMLNEENWRGMRGVDLIRVGTYFENKRLLDMSPFIEQQFKEQPNEKTY